MSTLLPIPPKSTTWVVRWQTAWSDRERALIVAAERRNAMLEGRAPRRTSKLPPPEQRSFANREAAERHATLLRAQHEIVAITINERRPRARPEQLQLADDWPLQMRPPSDAS